MKVLNPNTGQFEEVYVKALDSMPVGTEVDFDGQASDIPIGWEQVSGKTSVAYTLYNNSTGIKTGTTALEDNINNYDYIEVFGKNTDDNEALYVKIPSELYSISSMLLGCVMDGNMYIKWCKFNFTDSGATLRIGQNSSWYKNANSSSGAYDATGNPIAIIKIIGYKEV